jgi:site-specific DNA recombinase
VAAGDPDRSLLERLTEGIEDRRRKLAQFVEKQNPSVWQYVLMSPASRAVIYRRISSDPTGQQLGIERQELECRQLAEKQGWDIVAVFTDNDTSAYRSKPRAGYLQLLEAFPQIDIVIAWHPDRLHRSPRELEDFIDHVERHDIAVHTVRAGHYDLHTAAGRATARVIGSMARYESEQKGERQRAKQRELAAAGKLSGGGTRPFGYLKDRLTPHPTEPAIMAELIERAAGGEPLGSMCRDLKRRGISTVTETDWKPSVLKRMLVSPRIAGYRAHKGQIVSESEWPAVVNRDLWRKATQVLNDPNRRTNRGGRRYLLTGGIAIDYHERPMIARPNGKKVRCYVTLPDDNGPGSRIQAQPVEDLVVDALFAATDKVDLSRLEQPEIVVAETAPSVEVELRELAGRFASGEVTADEFSNRHTFLQARLDAARSIDAAPITATSPLAGEGAVRDTWPDLAFHDRRRILELFIDTVQIGQALRGRNTFDATRITIHWRE